jgi:hypothetical protein
MDMQLDPGLQQTFPNRVSVQHVVPALQHVLVVEPTQHVPGQHVPPQLTPHTPPQHSPDEHVVPQAPQFDGSLPRIAQTPLQLMLGAGHLHWPPTQFMLGSGQGAQPPQLKKSDEGSVQHREPRGHWSAHPSARWLGQHILSAEQQVPPQHWPPLQSWPQEPQFWELTVRSTQTLPQRLNGDKHWKSHMPLTQMASALAAAGRQTSPQAPQLLTSLSVFTQTPLQHALLQGGWPQPPQWSGSVEGSTHDPRQQMCEPSQPVW